MKSEFQSPTMLLLHHRKFKELLIVIDKFLLWEVSNTSEMLTCLILLFFSSLRSYIYANYYTAGHATSKY